ncbi:metal ABC transporter ATP-binding protein [Candidatus Peregrinibacteria bacterium]|nr:metal ABC transporter ATP-binding protein [Candidatus Peregrinibacteria bacterium]
MQIKVENISFNYRHNQVLEDVSFEIQTGDYVGIIGPNGGGKTTLLKLMTGLLKAQHGHISIFGMDPRKARAHGKIGYVPQRIVQSNIQCPATVEEIVASGRIAKSSDGKVIEAAMKDADVEQFRTRSIESLSGGERQRVFIARALASEPIILILDEPTTGVDLKAGRNFYALLKHLNKEHKLTIIIVSHDIEAVAKEVNMVLCLNRKLVSTCKHEDLKANTEEILKALYGPDKNFIHHQHA